MADPRPGDPADRAADGAFGGVQSHRAGYGDDKLQRLTKWLRAHPTATLASGEGALLLAENDRLRDAAKDSADHYADARAEIDRLRDQLHLADQSARSSRAEAERIRAEIERILTEARAEINQLCQRAERAERILAALRESSDGVQKAAWWGYWSVFPGGRHVWSRTIRAAVAAAELEVGNV